ncbi:peroxiredoxin [Xanthomonas arboricola]|uniref:thioredoxin-dependent peroxiredoxin n=1 Tax=Xanthomonas arboricola pv. corylina TaxID=487821 RepID=A0A2S7CB68_9XANT|nr:peroxiredoxin [Xanthomonas arboricola]MDN0209098.1 peroxiredoxin [Xanthomonas arboricola pv. corylina]MDN0213481.1 peroxiredoxin [Xanthomonas arboricola pv. corylina]PPU12586.1 peroxiredoxin [Xanthomonas arboricola pv. corylina]PPU58828.1 peroxiredoxin [Xanthomonas arboricola pv. corylina]UQQ09157.1 peroxiredoxin [Xanthomonas arboricola pv. corylina]
MTDAVLELPAASLDLPLLLSGGTHTTLRGYAGKWVVLYFYPKDSTPGCTTEGLDFNALLPQFTQAGAVVLGVSRDSVKSHDNFCAKQGFTFPLVSDGEQALCRAFDVIKEKNMYGKQVLGIERSTFLLSPEGAVVQAWRKVKVAGHADAVLAALKAHAGQ